VTLKNIKESRDYGPSHNQIQIWLYNILSGYAYKTALPGVLENFAVREFVMSMKP